MLYCEGCMKLTDEVIFEVTVKAHCPHCKRKRLREPQQDDPVYILSIDATFAASVLDILTQNNIPCLKRGTLGAGIVSYVGYSLENYDFYVPLELLENARELLENFIENAD